MKLFSSVSAFVLNVKRKVKKSIVSVKVVVTQTKLENRKEALSFAYVFVVLIQAVNLAAFCALYLHLLITLD